MLFEMSLHNLNGNGILLTGFTLVVIQIGNIAVAQEYFSTPKCQQSNEGGILTAKCGFDTTNANKDQNYYLPQTLPENLEVLDLTPNNLTDYVRYDFYPDDFQRYTKLKRLVIERSKPSTYQTFPKIIKVYQDCFRDAKSLQQFEFTNSNLSEKFIIGWPKNVKFLKIDNNKFQQLDLQGCKEIQELSANGNNLINLPKFHYPLPPIKIMRLKGNPLDNMTILTIAPLCELTLIELEFPPGSHYAQKGSLVSYCDCQLLKKWAHEADISGPDKIECVEPKKKVELCPEDKFEKAKKLHTKCPLLKSQKYIPILKWLKIVLFFIITLMMIAALILYVIRHFHLKEKWESRSQSSGASSPRDDSSEREEDRSSETEE